MYSTFRPRFDDHQQFTAADYEKEEQVEKENEAEEKKEELEKEEEEEEPEPTLVPPVLSSVLNSKANHHSGLIHASSLLSLQHRVLVSIVGYRMRAESHLGSAYVVEYSPA